MRSVHHLLLPLAPLHHLLRQRSRAVVEGFSEGHCDRHPLPPPHRGSAISHGNRPLGPVRWSTGVTRSTLNKTGACLVVVVVVVVFSCFYERGSLSCHDAYMHQTQRPNTWDDSRRRRHWASTSEWTESEKCREMRLNPSHSAPWDRRFQLLARTQSSPGSCRPAATTRESHTA